MFGKCSVNAHLVHIEQMLAHGTVERGGVTETGPWRRRGEGRVARGGSDGGERGPRGPVAVLPGLPPFLVALGGGLLPGFLPGIILEE